jgi:hypothetical protein
MEIYTKRKYLRVDITQQAMLDFGGTVYDPCRIKNISLTGMYIYGAFRQERGDECTIRYSQTCTASHFYFRARARVVRVARDGLAIEFVSMPFDSYMLLQTTLLYESVDPLEISLQLPENCPFEITIEVSRDEHRDDSTRPPLPMI